MYFNRNVHRLDLLLCEKGCKEIDVNKIGSFSISFETMDLEIRDFFFMDTKQRSEIIKLKAHHFDMISFDMKSVYAPKLLNCCIPQRLERSEMDSIVPYPDRTPLCGTKVSCYHRISSSNSPLIYLLLIGLH